MPENLVPGVYVGESNPGAHSITGVSTSTAAFLGIAKAGLFTPTLVTSFADYQSEFAADTGINYMWAAVRGFFENGGTRLYISRLHAEKHQDLAPALQALESVDASIICAPAVSADPNVAATLIEHCEKMRYRFAILDAPQSPAPTDGPPAALRSSFAAYYYPWVALPECADHGPIRVPPSGHIAGIYARTDQQQGVWHAPAGMPVIGIVGLDNVITDVQGEALNSAGVNVLRNFAGKGSLVWGARTTSQDPEWKYVNIRRYLSYLEHSIEAGTQWVVFEPNGDQLWAQVRNAVSNFLFTQWSNGALQGLKPEDAFFVRCDRTTMTQNDIDNGRLIVEVGVAPLRPAEFVIFRIGQWTANANPNGC